VLAIRLFFLSCCQTENATQQKARPELLSATTLEAGISMTVKLPSKGISGSSFPLSILVHNQGKAEAQIIDSIANPLEMRIVDSAGREVPFTRFGRKFYRTDVFHGSAAIRRLAPGESKLEVVELQRVFDLTLPGRYLLRIVSRRIDVPGSRFHLKIEKLAFFVSEPPL